MSGGAYRPEPPSPDEDLARLAAEGQRRILEARATAAGGRRRGDAKERERNVRVALGWHDHGTLARAGAIVLAVLGGGALVAASMLDVGALSWGAVALLGVPLLVLRGPRASRARVAAEEAWVRSLPFPASGYLEALGDPPELGMTLAVAITWREPPPAPDAGTLQGLLGVLDPAARVVACDATAARIRSGSISGWTGIRTPGAYVHRNTRLVGYVHRLVEDVLLPLHRAGHVERVAVTRE